MLCCAVLCDAVCSHIPVRSLVYSDELLYMFGGYTSDSAPSDQMWSFDLQQRRWQLETLTYATTEVKRIKYDFLLQLFRLSLVWNFHLLIAKGLATFTWLWK